MKKKIRQSINPKTAASPLTNHRQAVSDTTLTTNLEISLSIDSKSPTAKFCQQMHHFLLQVLLVAASLDSVIQSSHLMLANQQPPPLIKLIGGSASLYGDQKSTHEPYMLASARRVAQSILFEFPSSKFDKIGSLDWFPPQID